MKPEYLAIAAVLIAIVVLLSRAGRKRADAGDRPAPLSLTLPGGHPEHVLEAMGLSFPYRMVHFRATDPAGLRHRPVNTLSVIFRARTPNFVADNPGAHWGLTLRNDVERVNEHNYDKTNPRGPVNTGHGVVTGIWGAGSPDFPADSAPRYGAVIESFHKGPGEPTLYPATLSPVLDDAREWSYQIDSIVRHGRKWIRLRVFDDAGRLHHDSGEVEDLTAFDPAHDDVSFATIFYDPSKFGTSSRVEITELRFAWTGEEGEV